MNRIKEILERKAEINEILKDEKRSKDINLKDLEKEVRELNEELADLETRQRLLDETEQIESGKGEVRKIETFSAGGNKEERNEEVDPTDTMEYRKAFMNFVLTGESIPKELRADAITATTDVGSVIPNTVLNRIIEKLEATGMILPLVTRTSIRGGVTVPTSSVKPVASWVAEGAGSDKQKKTTGSITFAYHKLRCAVAVTLEVDTVSLAVFETTIVNNIVEAMTKAIEQAIISGDGNGKPKGILAETPATGQLVTAASLKYQTIVDAEAALPLEYEDGAVWTMTKKTFMGFIGMVDNDGQPIARVNYGIGGRPERTLLGRQVILCNYVPSFDTAATGDNVAFLFNYKDYILNTNYQMGIKKYTDNDTEDEIMKSVMLVDGKVVDNNSLVVIQKAASA